MSEPKKVDFILYKCKFAPIKFNLWNTWYKRLAKRTLGSRRAYWLFYRKALTVTYTANASAQDGESKIGRVT